MLRASDCSRCWVLPQQRASSPSTFKQRPSVSSPKEHRAAEQPEDTPENHHLEVQFRLKISFSASAQPLSIVVRDRLQFSKELIGSPRLGQCAQHLAVEQSVRCPCAIPPTVPSDWRDYRDEISIKPLSGMHSVALVLPKQKFLYEFGKVLPIDFVLYHIHYMSRIVLTSIFTLDPVVEIRPAPHMLIVPEGQAAQKTETKKMLSKRSANKEAVSHKEKPRAGGSTSRSSKRQRLKKLSNTPQQHREEGEGGEDDADDDDNGKTERDLPLDIGDDRGFRCPVFCKAQPKTREKHPCRFKVYPTAHDALRHARDYPYHKHCPICIRTSGIEGLLEGQHGEIPSCSLILHVFFANMRDARNHICRFHLSVIVCSIGTCGKKFGNLSAIRRKNHIKDHLRSTGSEEDARQAIDAVWEAKSAQLRLLRPQLFDLWEGIKSAKTQERLTSLLYVNNIKQYDTTDSTDNIPDKPDAAGVQIIPQIRHERSLIETREGSSHSVPQHYGFRPPPDSQPIAITPDSHHLSRGQEIPSQFPEVMESWLASQPQNGFQGQNDVFEQFMTLSESPTPTQSFHNPVPQDSHGLHSQMANPEDCFANRSYSQGAATRSLEDMQTLTKWRAYLAEMSTLLEQANVEIKMAMANDLMQNSPFLAFFGEYMGSIQAAIDGNPVASRITQVHNHDSGIATTVGSSELHAQFQRDGLSSFQYQPSHMVGQPASNNFQLQPNSQTDADELRGGPRQNPFWRPNRQH